MKNIYKTLIVAIAFALLLPVDAGAQGKIVTKKLRLSDLTTKTTKVVLSGNEVFDIAFKSEITRRWRISPYDFCSQSEYEKLKKSPEYYFLVPVLNQRKKETGPGTAMLCFEKGGIPDSSDPDKEALEVISIPYGPADDISGRELVFIPAIIDIIQNFSLVAMTKDSIAYGGLSSYVASTKKNWKKNIFISVDDIFKTGSDVLDIKIMDEDTVDDVFSAETANTIIGYVVAPLNPEKGSICYKMLFTSDTHELYYFDSHVISEKKGRGFLENDLRRISFLKK